MAKQKQNLKDALIWIKLFMIIFVLMGIASALLVSGFFEAFFEKNKVVILLVSTLMFIIAFYSFGRFFYELNK